MENGAVWHRHVDHIKDSAPSAEMPPLPTDLEQDTSEPPEVSMSSPSAVTPVECPSTGQEAAPRQVIKTNSLPCIRQLRIER